MSRYFPAPDECSVHTIFPGVRARTMAEEKMLVAVVELEPNSVVTEHSHPHEQMGMWLEGRAIFYIGDEQKTVGPGDIYRIPGHVKHKVVVLDEPARALDVFAPIREEYR